MNPPPRRSLFDDDPRHGLPSEPTVPRCRVCSQPRASSAVVCPHCGDRRHRIGWAIAFPLIIVGLLVFLFWLNAPTPEEAAKEWVRQNMKKGAPR